MKTHTFKIIYPYYGTITAEEIMTAASDSYYNNADDYTGFDDAIPVYNDPKIKKPENINQAMFWLEDRGEYTFGKDAFYCPVCCDSQCEVKSFDCGK